MENFKKLVLTLILFSSLLMTCINAQANDNIKFNNQGYKGDFITKMTSKNINVKNGNFGSDYFSNEKNKVIYVNCLNLNHSNSFVLISNKTYKIKPKTAIIFNHSNQQQKLFIPVR